MRKRSVDQAALPAFVRYLKNEERSPATLSKYTHDVAHLFTYLEGRAISREEVLGYKENLLRHYAVRSANSMLAAVNAFFRFCGRLDLCVKRFRVQRDAFSPAEKELTREEYLRLVSSARANQNERLSLVIETICATGIRVSELSSITAEAARAGEATVTCKGKTRRVFIVRELQRKLVNYARGHGITAGPVFLSRNGRPLSRHDVWRGMKALCRAAGVAPAKVFPHNLRHLFARTFYGIEKDIAKLADVLGHASIDTTRIYIATTCREHKRKMERMRLIL